VVVEGAGGIDVVWTGVEVRSGVVDVLSGVVVVAFVGVSCCEGDVGGLVGWAGMSLERELTAKRGHYEQKLASSGEGQESCQAGETCCFPGEQRAFYGGQPSFAAESLF